MGGNTKVFFFENRICLCREFIEVCVCEHGCAHLCTCVYSLNMIVYIYVLQYEVENIPIETEVPRLLQRPSSAKTPASEPMLPMSKFFFLSKAIEKTISQRLRKSDFKKKNCAFYFSDQAIVALKSLDFARHADTYYVSPSVGETYSFCSGCMSVPLSARHEFVSAP